MARREWTNPSEFRCLVIVETPIKAKDSAGEEVISGWNPFPDNTNGEHFVKLFGLGGSEVIEAGRQGLVLTHGAHLRYVVGLTSDMRLSVVGATPARVLHIVSIVDWKEQRREHRLLLREAI